MKPVISDEQAELLIRECQAEAQIAIDEGNPPFSCIITDAYGAILVQTHNTQNTQNDPTAHAEIRALSQLGRTRGSRFLDGCVMFSNAESCSMCMSAAIKAKIDIFFYGAAAEPMNPSITMADIASKCSAPLKITGGILARDCAAQIAAGRKNETLSI